MGVSTFTKFVSDDKKSVVYIMGAALASAVVIKRQRGSYVHVYYYGDITIEGGITFSFPEERKCSGSLFIKPDEHIYLDLRLYSLKDSDRLLDLGPVGIFLRPLGVVGCNITVPA